ncbi:uncharacterized protein UTRI_06470 [Ustilago trichophora]|uniref:Uncharacterized protein n=1 Tax=Ustilago trichophora TaxID=86804 RepID=A0A5C3EKE7_9BASI|nr:uncharacterized protein UTRI_06470 [Ustilago trichophora]
MTLQSSHCIMVWTKRMASLCNHHRAIAFTDPTNTHVWCDGAELLINDRPDVISLLKLLAANIWFDLAKHLFSNVEPQCIWQEEEWLVSSSCDGCNNSLAVVKANIVKQESAVLAFNQCKVQPSYKPSQKGELKITLDCLTTRSRLRAPSRGRTGHRWSNVA